VFLEDVDGRSHHVAGRGVGFSEVEEPLLDLGQEYDVPHASITTPELYNARAVPALAVSALRDI
jgi:hypothetical protein